MENKEVLIYDITSIPNQVGLNMQQIFEAYKNHRIVVWDSIDGGVEPKIINIDENSPPPFVVDLSSTELSEETWKKIKNEVGE